MIFLDLEIFVYCKNDINFFFLIDGEREIIGENFWELGKCIYKIFV